MPKQAFNMDNTSRHANVDLGKVQEVSTLDKELKTANVEEWRNSFPRKSILVAYPILNGLP